jgi:hypothetical protein
MSRRAILERLIATERLFERPTQYAGYDTGRRMYVTPEILALTRPPFADTREGERLGEFAAMLDAFSEMGVFSVAEDPDQKPHEAMLARTRPVCADFWSIRVTAPEDTPGLRALGAFIDHDEFVVLHWDFRENMSFNEDVDIAIQVWRDLFGAVYPHSGAHIRNYISQFWEV